MYNLCSFAQTFIQIKIINLDEFVTQCRNNYYISNMYNSPPIEIIISHPTEQPKKISIDRNNHLIDRLKKRRTNIMYDVTFSRHTMYQLFMPRVFFSLKIMAQEMETLDPLHA